MMSSKHINEKLNKKELLWISKLSEAALVKGLTQKKKVREQREKKKSRVCRGFNISGVRRSVVGTVGVCLVSLCL